jgi:hypothetical protein
MSANLPTKTPDAPLDKPAENKFDRFRPDMPKIPGVSQEPRQAAHGAAGMPSQRMTQIGGVAAAVLVAAIIFWGLKSKRHATANSSADSDIAEQVASDSAPPNPIAAAHEGPTVAATVDELSKPWAAKKFIFVNRLTQENIDAMVIRLPSGEFWAFSLQAPFGRCELEYVTDLATLSTQYRFKASHPMVVSPCESSVFDPLKVGPLQGNTWARGEVVQGSSLRPPISIDVKVSDRSIVADEIE